MALLSEEQKAQLKDLEAQAEADRKLKAAERKQAKQEAQGAQAPTTKPAD
jgi:hypothetical protein